MKPLRIPAPARWMLRLTLPRQWHDSILADLSDEARRLQRQRGRTSALWWLWRQSLAFSWRFQSHRLRCLGGRLRPAFLSHRSWSRTMTRLSWADLKLIGRQLTRTPLFVLTSVLALAAAIAVLATAWSFTSSILWGELPFPDGDRIVSVGDRHQAAGYNLNIDLERYQYLRENATAFTALGAFAGQRLSLITADGNAAVVQAAAVTPEVLNITGVAPLRGRPLTEQDVLLGQAVALIGEDLWRDRLQGDPATLGSTVLVGGVPRTVVGIMPSGFAFPSNHDLWIPLERQPGGSPASQQLKLVGRLADSVAPDQAAAELFELTRRRPVSGYRPEDIVQQVKPFVREGIPEEMVIVFWLLLIILGLVLLVVAANVANLLLVRTAIRTGELAVRKALGARRRDLFALLFFEALAIGLAAAFLGGLASRAMLSWLQVQIDDLPFWADLQFSPLTVAVIALWVVAASAVVALLPAWKAAGADFHGVLKMGRSASSLSYRRLGRLLIVCELALSVGFLAAAAALAGDLAGYAGFRPGPEAQGVLVAQLYFGQPSPAPHGVSVRQNWNRFLEQAERRRQLIRRHVESMAGVEEVAFATHVPGYQLSTSPFQTQRQAQRNEAPSGRVNVVHIDGPYFRLLGQKTALRTPWQSKDAVPAPIALANDPLSRRYLNASAGSLLRLPAGATESQRWGQWIEVTGTVPDVGISPFDSSRSPTLYRPWEATNIALLLVRAKGEPQALGPRLFAALEAVDPATDLQWIQPLSQVMGTLASILARLSLGLLLLGGFALLLSGAGLYSIASLAVVKRQAEIGLRAALGAGRSRLLLATLAPGLRHLFLGALFGTVIAVILKRAFYAFYYLGDGRPPDFASDLLPLTLKADFAVVLLASSGLMIVVGLLAFLLPARRILSISPAEAIRQET